MARDRAPSARARAAAPRRSGPCRRGRRGRRHLPVVAREVHFGYSYLVVLGSRPRRRPPRRLVVALAARVFRQVGGDLVDGGRGHLRASALRTPEARSRLARPIPTGPASDSALWRRQRGSLRPSRARPWARARSDASRPLRPPRFRPGRGLRRESRFPGHGCVSASSRATTGPTSEGTHRRTFWRDATARFSAPGSSGPNLVTLAWGTAESPACGATDRRRPAPARRRAGAPSGRSRACASRGRRRARRARTCQSAAANALAV